MSLDRVLPQRGWVDMDWSKITLPPHLVTCEICKGKGRYEQTYIAGCGMGYYKSVGRCIFCDGVGLRLDLDNPFVNTSLLKVSADDIAPLLALLAEQKN